MFDKVVAFVRGLSDFEQLAFLSQISSNEKLKLYALFKQATVGPCSGPRPSFFDMQGKYKYDAWKELGDMSRSNAMTAYVEHVIEYAMSVHASVADLSSLNLSAAHRSFAEDLRSRVDDLKRDCALLWPQRFAHLRSPDSAEVAEDIYEKEYYLSIYPSFINNL